MKKLINNNNHTAIIKSIKRKIAVFVNNIVYILASIKPIDKMMIIFESEGDLCDNAYALYDCFMKFPEYSSYHIYWAVDDVEEAKKSNLTDRRVQFISKNTNKINFSLMVALAHTRYYIYDHNNLYAYLKLKKRSKQTIAYLSHGRGFKAIKGYNKGYFDVMFATGDIPAKGLSYFWGCKYEDVKQLGYPRIDYFFENNEYAFNQLDALINLSKYEKTIMWMPTFRQSNNEAISENYIKNETGLPLIHSKQELLDLNEFLKAYNALLVLKVHHLQADLPVFSEKFSNIIILRDQELKQVSVQLYQFVALTDALITDYSSISIDYLPLDKPVVYTLDDYEQYAQSRGFYPDNAVDYFKGAHVYNLESLKESLKDICEGKDIYKDERRSMIQQFFKYVDGGSSKRILEYLKIL